MKIKANNCLKSSKKKRKISQMDLQMFTMTLPAVIKILIFSYLPMFGIVLAFKELNYSDGIWNSPWIGLKNFEFFFKSEAAWRTTKNTLVMNALFLTTGHLAAVVAAAMLYRISHHKKRLKTYQTIMFFPYFVSWILVSFMLSTLIGAHGIVPKLLSSLGIESGNIMLEAKNWPLIFVLANIWKTVGYYSIVYFATLLSIDVSLYEAAELDGANSWQVLAKIQIPHLTYMIVLFILMGIGNIFKADFGMFYFLPGTGNSLVYEWTDVIDTYAYRALKEQSNLSMSAAVGVYQSVVGLILISLSNFIVKRYDKSMSLY